MKKINEGVTSMNILAIDIVSAKPIQNVYLEILKENYQQPDE